MCGSVFTTREQRGLPWVVALLGFVCGGLCLRAAAAGQGPLRRGHPAAEWRMPVATAIPAPVLWVGAALDRDAHARFALRGSLSLLAGFEDPSSERRGPWRRFRDGPYGLRPWLPALTWNRAEGGFSASPVWEPESTALGKGSALQAGGLPQTEGYHFSWQDSDLTSAGYFGSLPQLVPLPASPPPPEPVPLGRAVECPAWRRIRPIQLARLDGELDTFALLECDGSVAPEAMDRLSVLMRPPGTPRPSLPLPAEATVSNSGEWVPGVRMVHPRLVWLVQQLALAFPRRLFTIVSGYRAEPITSAHARGRAIDLQILGVPNESVFRFCRKLEDVGCGYYPNNRFLHLDVRPPGSGHPYWVDVAEPGAPSQYVDSWPGVVEGGALAWGGDG